MGGSSSRVLILEFVSADKFFNHNAELLPFVAASVRGAGHELEYLCFGWDPWSMPESPFVVELTDSDLEVLGAHLEARPPSYIITNQTLSGKTGELVRSLVPAAVVCLGTREGIFNHQEFLTLGVNPWLVSGARVEPDYSCILGNAAAEEIKPFVVLLGGSICLNSSRLADNPYYCDPELKLVENHRGCAFCMHPSEISDKDYRDSVPSALTQIRRSIETLPQGKRSDQYQLDNAVLFFRLEEFVQGILELELPPSVFLLSCRIDEFVARLEVIESVLKRFARVGHHLAISNMGVENFSEVENLRLNKGITLKDVEQAHGAILDLEQRYPEAFSFRRFGGFGFILFTPWTRLEDLRINLDAARRLEIPDTNHLFTTRLILMPGTPITELAIRDNLVTERFEFSRGRVFGAEEVQFSHGDRERAWRFQDPRLGVVYSIAYRMDQTQPIAPDDPDLALVRELLALLPEDARGCYQVLPMVLDMLEQNPDFTQVDQVISGLRERFKTEPPWFSTGQMRGVLHLARVLDKRNQPFPGGFRLNHQTSELVAGVKDGMVFERPGERVIVAIRSLERDDAFFFRGETLGLLHSSLTPPATAPARLLMRYLVPGLELFLREGRVADWESEELAVGQGGPGFAALVRAVKAVIGDPRLAPYITFVAPVPQDRPRVEVGIDLKPGKLEIFLERAPDDGTFFHHRGTVGLRFSTGVVDTVKKQKMLRFVGTRVSLLVDGPDLPTE